MPLGRELGLGPRVRCVRCGPSSPPSERGTAAPPHFLTHVYCGQTAGWIRIPLGTEVGLGPGDMVLDGDPAPPPPQKGNSSPTFRPMSIVAKWSSISAIAELLYYLAVILSGFYFIRCIELLQLVCLYVIFFLILSSLRHVVTLLSQLFSKWICYIRLSFEMIPSTTSIVTAVCRPKHTGYQ